MRWLHSLAKIHATFDDPKLASRADLVPVMPLAQLAGLAVAWTTWLALKCGPPTGAGERGGEGGLLGRRDGLGRTTSMTWVPHEAHCLYRRHSGRGPEEVSVRDTAKSRSCGLEQL
jgi:hypothetical protein